MAALFLDTHALVWCLTDPPRLSPAARAAIDAAVAAGDTLYVATLTFVELAYLEEKGRLPAGTLDLVLAEVRQPGSLFVPVPLSTAVALTLRTVPRDAVPDMPDRIIAASAVHVGVPLVTKDSEIRGSGIAVVW